MKVKASITLSDTLIRAIDKLIGKGGNRSAFIEEALHEFITRAERARRGARDLEILNANARAGGDRDLSDDLAYFRELALASWDARDDAEATAKATRPKSTARSPVRRIRRSRR